MKLPARVIFFNKQAFLYLAKNQTFILNPHFGGDIVIFFRKFVRLRAKIICFFPDRIGGRSNLRVFIYSKPVLG